MNFRNQVLQTATILLSRGLGAVAQLVLNIVLGRYLGPAGVGHYFLFTSWVRLLAAVGGLGLPTQSLRRVSELPADAGGEARRHVLRACAIGFLVFAPSAVLLLSVAPQMAALLWAGEVPSSILRAIVVATPLFFALRIVVESLKGRRLANFALNLEFLFVPVALLAAALVAGSIGTLDAMGAAWLYAAATGITFVFGFGVFWRSTRHGNHRTPRVTEPQRDVSLSFWGLQILTVGSANLPFIILPFIASEADVGRFGAALRLVTVAAMVNGTLASIYSPRFARAFRSGDRRRLIEDLRASRVSSILLFVPFLTAFFIWGGTILRIFGPEFGAAEGLLRILAMGQAVNAATGLTGAFLNMVGRARTQLWLTVAAVAAMTLIALAGGHSHGAVAMALGYSTAMAIQHGGALVATHHVFREWRRSDSFPHP